MPTLSAAVPLFAGLPKEAVDSILSSAVRRDYRAGKIIMVPDRPAKNLFLVQSGAVDYLVYSRAEQEALIRRFVHGDAFGIATFLTEPLGYLGTARAVRNSVLYVWDRDTVLRLARVYPRLEENALHIALRYVTIYANRHLRLAFDSAERRLAKVLTTLGSRTGMPHSNGVEVEIKNEQLASLADVGPFTTSRILRNWERHGAICKKRGRVVIQAPEKLLT